MKKSSKRFVITEESLNMYGFRIRTLGIDMSRFNDNPVCTLNHNYEKAIGQWTDIQIGTTSMSAVPSFDENDPEAMLIYDKIEQGIIKTASVGVFPLEMQGEWLERCEMLEIAIAPVPGNKNASVVLYGADGVQLKSSDAKTLLLSVQKDTNQKEENTNQLKIMNKELLAALVLLCAQAGVTVQLSADAKDEDIQKAMGSIGNKVVALTASNQALKTANDEFQTQALTAKNAEVATLVDSAIADKRITADKRETFVKLAAADFELCKSTLESLKPVTLSIVPGAAAAKADASDAADRAAWTFDEYMEKDGIGLSAMQTNDSEKFNALYAAKVAEMKAKGAIA